MDQRLRQEARGWSSGEGFAAFLSEGGGGGACSLADLSAGP